MHEPHYGGVCIDGANVSQTTIFSHMPNQSRAYNQPYGMYILETSNSNCCEFVVPQQVAPMNEHWVGSRIFNQQYANILNSIAYVHDSIAYVSMMDMM